MWNSLRYSRPRAMKTSESGCCHNTSTRFPVSPSLRAVSGRLTIGILDMGEFLRVAGGCEIIVAARALSTARCPHCARSEPLLLADDPQHVIDVVVILSARRRGARDIIEHAAVLQAIMREQLHAPGLVEIDPHHAQIGDLRRHELAGG